MEEFNCLDLCESVSSVNSILQQSENLMIKANRDYLISFNYLIKIHEKSFLDQLMEADTRYKVNKVYRYLESLNNMPELFLMYKKLRLAVLTR